jgi:hypothetical protein
MADIVSDGRTRVYYVASISNIAAPTVAELNAGIRLDQLITADGYIGFRPETADVPTTPLSGTFNTNKNGRVSFSGTMLRIKKQDGTDTVYDTLVKDTEGYLVERRSSSAGTAWAAAQKAKVFPIVCGETAWLDPEENTVERYEVPIKMRDQPELRATVAA